MRNPDESAVKETLKRVQREAGMPLWEMNISQDFKVQFRVDEKISPAKFKPDPLIPGGYLCNSLTLRAMRPTLFVADNAFIELADTQHCACGHEWDAQFWRLCPYCGRNACS